MNLIPVGVSKYKGDGTISSILFLPNQGVRVDFDPFPLNAPFHKEYRLDGLPEHSSGYDVGLIPDIKKSYDQHPPELLTQGEGNLRLRLLDSDNRVIFDVESSLDQLAWGWVEDDHFGRIATKGSDGELIQSSIRASQFSDPSHRPRVLEVDYSPDPRSLSISGRICLFAGGAT